MSNEPLKPLELTVGFKISLPNFRLSEKEIIDFALANDPQEIHINPEIAQKSYFKGLIACGAHAYVKTHKDCWIDLVKESFICGLEINNWKFLKPIYADQWICPTLRIVERKENSDGRTAAITWKFEFWNESKELFQQLDVKVLHRIG